MNQIYLLLGSNLGNRILNMRGARLELDEKVGDSVREVELGDDRGEPATPDDGQVGVALAHGLGGHVAVVDLVAQDARAGEAQGAVAGLEDLLDVVRIDHRVDHHDLVAGRGRSGRDLQQLERQQVGAEDLAARRVRPVGQEQDDLLGLLDHGGRVLRPGRGA